MTSHSFKITIWGYTATVEVFPLEATFLILGRDLSRRVGIYGPSERTFNYADSSSAYRAILDEVAYLEKRYQAKVEVYASTIDGQTGKLKHFSTDEE